MGNSHTPQYTDDPQITRARIAELADVTRPTVTLWERRSPDFPAPRKAGGAAYFRQSDVLRWLEVRKVPLHLRRPGEGDEATYGQRARAAVARAALAPAETEAGQLVLEAAEFPDRPPAAAEQRAEQRASEPANRHLVHELMGPLADQARGPGSMVNYLHLLLGLHFLRTASGARWTEVRARAAAIDAAGGAGSELLEHIGREVDTEVKRLGMLPHFTDSLTDLIPRSVGVLTQVMRLVAKLDGNAFELIIEEYEAHGRLRSREFFTPKGVVHLMAGLAGQGAFAGGSDGRVPRTAYDPYVRGGECLVEAFAFTEGLRRQHPDREPLKVFGQTTVSAAGLLASLNLALHGVRAGVRLERREPWAGGLETAGRADLVLTNPPFNMNNSAGQARRTGTWPYGPPPLDNDNFAYVQHVLASLREGGRAAMVMPTKAGNSDSAAETAIRKAMVKAGVVECVIALPARLFSGTAVPVSVWLLRHPGEPCEQVLFLDARRLGTRRGPRSVLEEAEARALLDTYRSHVASRQRREPDRVSHPAGVDPESVPSALVSRKALLDEVCSLNPADHVPPAGSDGDHRPTEEAGPRAEVLEARAWDEVASLRARCAEADAYAEALRGRPLPEEGSEADWRTADLAALCEIKAGPSFTQLGKKDRSPAGDVPVVFPRHLRGGRITDTGEERISWQLARRLAHFTLEAGDILCVRAGKTAPPAIVRADQAGWLPSANLTRLRVRKDAGVDPAYLLAWLSRPDVLAWVEERSAATAASSISTGTLGRLDVRLPPLPEQRRTAELLAGLEEQALAHRDLAAAVTRARDLLVERVMNPTPTSP
ncbi:N-6 DNA methylase [Streptomyces sp. NPDC059193]|uniref:N-6 DNA methylase n=1 Tax=Streptomyces sp. NPDC059193 TaxID=3346763 RepID=UPI0036BA8162